MNYAQENGSKTKKRKASNAASGDVADAGVALRDRVEHVRDIVEDVRDRAQATFRDKPYLVPVAAGAVGFGVGMLFGSKLTRLLVITAVGTVLSDVLGGEVKRLAGDFINEFQHRLGEADDSEEVEAKDSAAV